MVRILTLLAVLHTFVGIMLVSVAIMLLDPSAQSPDAGGGKIATTVAGAFGVGMSSLAVLCAFLTRRRYSTRTWFT